MSTFQSVAELMLSEVTVPAERVLDLEINLIDDAVMRMPYGSPNMNLLATKTVLALV
jgi:hypothetical protein